MGAYENPQRYTGPTEGEIWANALSKSANMIAESIKENAKRKEKEIADRLKINQAEKAGEIQGQKEGAEIDYGKTPVSNVLRNYGVKFHKDVFGTSARLLNTNDPEEANSLEIKNDKNQAQKANFLPSIKYMQDRFANGAESLFIYGQSGGAGSGTRDPYAPDFKEDAMLINAESTGNFVSRTPTVYENNYTGVKYIVKDSDGNNVTIDVDPNKSLDQTMVPDVDGDLTKFLNNSEYFENGSLSGVALLKDEKNEIVYSDPTTKIINGSSITTRKPQVNPAFNDFSSMASSNAFASYSQKQKASAINNTLMPAGTQINIGGISKELRKKLNIADDAETLTIDQTKREELLDWTSPKDGSGGYYAAKGNEQLLYNEFFDVLANAYTTKKISEISSNDKLLKVDELKRVLPKDTETKTGRLDVLSDAFNTGKSFVSPGSSFKLETITSEKYAEIKPDEKTEKQDGKKADTAGWFQDKTTGNYFRVIGKDGTPIDTITNKREAFQHFAVLDEPKGVNQTFNSGN